MNNYEQKYKEALDQANVIHKSIRSDLKQVIEQIFPELKESEDERIRREIIDFLKHKTIPLQKYNAWIACLESLKDRVQTQTKQEWSEEDEENIMMIEDRFSDYLDYIREDSSLTKYKKNSLKEEVIGYVNWLKSLRPQNTWKPSEEEKAALRTAIHIMTEERNFPKLGAYLQNILNAFEGQSRKEWKPSKEQM